MCGAALYDCPTSASCSAGKVQVEPSQDHGCYRCRQQVTGTETTLCLKRNIPDIFGCNSEKNYPILIIFSANIPDKTCHQNDHSVSHFA